MDKELPKSRLTIKPGKILIRVSECHLPGVKAYRASVPFRRTINEEDLANRLVKGGCSLRKETLLAAYSLMNDEIYNAIEDGFNVDFGLGRTEITVNGSFISEFDKFDRKRHTLTPRLRPSPRLKQTTANIPAENAGAGLYRNAPLPNNISQSIKPYSRDEEQSFNTLPVGLLSHVSIWGRRLKLMGDLPGVGITMRCMETGEEYFISPEEVIINSSTRLCFVPKLPFTPGKWEVEIVTQFTPTYHLYKQVRSECLSFTVLDDASKY